MPTDPNRCIYLDPARGYHMCMLPVAPGAVLLCAKHLAIAKLEYREEQRRKAEDMLREQHREEEP